MDNDIFSRQDESFFVRNVNKLGWIMLFGFSLYMILGGSTAYGYLACLGVFAFFLRKDVKFTDIFKPKKKMTVPVFIGTLLLLQSILFFSVISENIVESTFNSLGWSAGMTVKEGLEGYDYEPTSLNNILLFGIFGPIMEEIIMRGYLMRAYHQYSGSKILAIVMSSFVFGSLHCSFHHFAVFMVSAFVMGYLAMEYGIIWSMLNHIITNLIMSQFFLNEILMRLPVEKRYPVGMAFSGIIALGAVIVLVLKRRDIADYVREEYCDKGQFKIAAVSLPFILFVILIFILTFIRAERYV